MTGPTDDTTTNDQVRFVCSACGRPAHYLDVGHDGQRSTCGSVTCETAFEAGRRDALREAEGRLPFHIRAWLSLPRESQDRAIKCLRDVRFDNAPGALEELRELGAPAVAAGLLAYTPAEAESLLPEIASVFRTASEEYVYWLDVRPYDDDDPVQARLAALAEELLALVYKAPAPAVAAVLNVRVVDEDVDDPDVPPRRRALLEETSDDGE